MLKPTIKQKPRDDLLLFEQEVVSDPFSSVLTRFVRSVAGRSQCDTACISPPPQLLLPVSIIANNHKNVSISTTWHVVFFFLSASNGLKNTRNQVNKQ